MRCDRCGAEIPPGQAIETTKTEQIGPYAFGARTRTVVIHVCPDCVASQGHIVWAAVLIFVILVALVVLSWVL